MHTLWKCCWYTVGRISKLHGGADIHEHFASEVLVFAGNFAVFNTCIAVDRLYVYTYIYTFLF